MASDTSLKLVPYNRDYKGSAKEILEEALELDFDSVIVVGFKGDSVSTKYSANTSFVKTIGAMEQAKHVMLTNMNE